jgi:hypothetical protein
MLRFLHIVFKLLPARNFLVCHSAFRRQVLSPTLPGLRHNTTHSTSKGQSGRTAHFGDPWHCFENSQRYSEAAQMLVCFGRGWPTMALSFATTVRPLFRDSPDIDATKASASTFRNGEVATSFYRDQSVRFDHRLAIRELRSDYQ